MVYAGRRFQIKRPTTDGYMYNIPSLIREGEFTVIYSSICDH